MARSPDNNPLAFPSEVARFLCVEHEHVKSMVKLDKLPAIEIPLKKRKVLRIPMREFHAWLQARAVKRGEVLTSYETFTDDFNKTARAAA